MVAVERWLDSDRIHRSVWRCAFTNTNSDTDADTNTFADAVDGVAE